jgi:simple sugar transport system ATP-binding protein
LIFDEPTAVLTPQEAVDLFAAFRALIEQQRTVVFISHKLSEVTGVTDRVAVMRAGRVVGEFETATTTEEQLAELMVGRRVLLHRGTASRVALGRHVDAATRGSGVERDAPSAVAVQPRLLVDGLQVVGDLGEVAVDVASFEVRPGEILGIAGVAGNGQLELEEAIAGLRRASRGHVVIDGVEVTRASIRRRRELGLSYVPEDRVATGTHRQSTVGENFIMGAHYKSPIAQGGRLRPEPIRQYVERLLGRFDIAAGGAHARLANLSGGNIQKVVVAREIAGTPEILGHEVPRVLIASQPTRGVDVGAIEYIHAQLIQLRAKGAAVLLISFELDEILFLSDTIRVLYNGVLSEALDPEAVTERQLGLLMGGANPMLAGSTTVAAP